MKNFFNLYFSLLNETDLVYGVTGRTENYPYDIHSDIDIVIPHNQLDKFWLYMKSLSSKGVDWIQVISHEAEAHYCIVTLSDGVNHQILKPDICTDYYRDAKLFVKADYLLQNRIFDERGFYCLEASKEFIYYLLKKVDKGYISKEQFNHLLKQWQTNSNDCKKELSAFFSLSNQKLIESIFTQSSIELFERSNSLLKEDLHKKLKFNLKDFLKKVQNRISRVVSPTGFVIAFMGPDGCGKTTIINGVQEDFTEIFRQNRQYHLYPKEMGAHIPNEDPHANKKRGLIGSVFKLFYFFNLYTLGYWFKIMPLKMKSTFVIFDRYYHDILVDPIRYRNGSGVFLTKWVGYLIPKPDLWILLNAPAEVVQKRKSEVTPEETARQLKSYNDLFGTLKNARVINGNQLAEKVIYDVEKEIIDYLKNRTANRYKNY